MEPVFIVQQVFYLLYCSVMIFFFITQLILRARKEEQRKAQSIHQLEAIKKLFQWMGLLGAICLLCRSIDPNGMWHILPTPVIYMFDDNATNFFLIACYFTSFEAYSLFYEQMGQTSPNSGTQALKQICAVLFVCHVVAVNGINVILLMNNKFWIRGVVQLLFALNLFLFVVLAEWLGWKLKESFRRLFPAQSTTWSKVMNTDESLSPSPSTFRRKGKATTLPTPDNAVHLVDRRVHWIIGRWTFLQRGAQILALIAVGILCWYGESVVTLPHNEELWCCQYRLSEDSLVWLQFFALLLLLWFSWTPGSCSAYSCNGLLYCGCTDCGFPEGGVTPSQVDNGLTQKSNIQQNSQSSYHPPLTVPITPHSATSTEGYISSSSGGHRTEKRPPRRPREGSQPSVQKEQEPPLAETLDLPPSSSFAIDCVEEGRISRSESRNPKGLMPEDEDAREFVEPLASRTCILM